MAPTPAPTIPGYELIRELGAGGMATVYLAIQRSLERKIAIKIMRRGLGGDEQEKGEKRFLVEGRTMAKLPHRNIVAVYDIVKQDEYAYIAMEFLEGGTLSDKMKSGLSLAEAISVVAQIAGALQFAHDHGVVHRDLKPANIMFRDEHTPVLTDFGIAKQQDASATRLTQTGMLVGTPTYMSPEQINALEVDGRSDLYSLGVLFFELLTGKPPFRGDTPISVLMSHLTTPPPPLPDNFGEFQPVLDKMLAKSRDDRFASMKDFTRALKSSVTHNQVLWQRLQADPNQSSSEQLRALGFSISTQEGAGAELHLPLRNTGGSPQPSGELAARAAGLLGGQTPTTVARRPVKSAADQMADAVSSSASRTAPTTLSKRPNVEVAPAAPVAMPAGSNRKWLWPAVAVVLIGLGVGSWMMFKPKGLDPTLQKIVDSALLQYDDALAKGNLIEPAEQCALDRLIPLREQAPNYAPVQERVLSLQKALEEQAKALASQGDFDAANLMVRKLQEFEPNHPGLSSLLDEIIAKQKIALNQKQVDQLLRDAEAALAAERTVGADGAYALVQKARGLIPTDAKANALLERVLTRALQPARERLRAGELDAADASLALLKTYLANEPDFQKLDKDIQGARDKAARAAQLAAFWQRFDQYMASNQLLEPASGNAYSTLEEARRLAGDGDPAVVAKQAQLLGRLVDAAQRKLKSGSASDAIALADIALKLDAEDTAASAIRREAEGQLSARERSIASALTRAREALAAQRFVTPANDNVKLHLDAALKDDPNQADAKRMLAELPEQIANAARAAINAKDLTRAQSILAAAGGVFPNDSKLNALNRELTGQQQQLQAQQDREKTLDRIAQVIATRPLDAKAFADAARELQALLARNNRDLDAASLRQRMIDVMVEDAQSASSAAELSKVQTLFDSVRVALSGANTLPNVIKALESARPRVAKVEADRLAATGGVLVIDATPWAMVESVSGVNGPVNLPSVRETPLRLQVPAGVYQITLRHPGARSSVTLSAQVKTKSETLASKAQLIGTREEYLQRAKL